MAAGDIWLNLIQQTGTSTSTTTDAPDLLSPFGRTFSEGRIELSRIDRTANARLVADYINSKRKFTLSYSLINNTDLDELLWYYDKQYDHFLLYLTIEYTDTRIESYDVIMAPIDRERVLVTNSGLWSGVTIEFEEI